MMKRRTYALLFCALVSAALPLLAIETGEVRGRVVDEQGAAIPAVEVHITGPSLQGSRTVLTGRNGEFQAPLLPVGHYTLRLRLQGFAPVVQENVIVRLGQATNVTVTMRLAAEAKEVVVVAQAPLIDKTASDTSFHITSEDLEKLPAQNRTVVDAVKYAPGAVGVRVNTRRGVATEGQPSFRGEGEEGNTWIVDGLSISGVRMRNSGVRLNTDAIEEIQVISDAFSPEFGSAYGGLINMVSKTGGNDWSGSFSLVFQDRNLQAAKQDQLSVVSAPAYFSNYNWFSNLGGPLIRDRLWFFLSENFYADTEESREDVVDYLTIPAGRKTTRNNNLFAKVTYALAANHSLSLTAIHHRSLGQSGGLGFPELFDEERFTDTLARLNYKGILGPTTFVEAGFGFVRRDDFTTPADSDLGPGMYYIEDLARNVHNSYGNITDNQRRLDASLKLTKVFDTPNFGRHDLSLGMEYYRLSSDWVVDFTGQAEDIFPGDGFDAGTKYYFDSWRTGRRTPTVFFEYGQLRFVNTSTGIGLFARDKVTWGRVTVMAGLRSQTQTNLDDTRDLLWSWGLGDFLSPRFSLAVDVTGDGANVLKFGWGRFSDTITTMPLGFFNPGAGLTFRTYRWQGGANPSETELHNPVNWRLENEQKTQPMEIAKGLEPNFVTRFLVEFDRRLAADWAVKVRYIQAEANDLLEILAVYDPQTTYKFLYDNFEHKRRNYRGVEVELTGRIGDRLFLNASYAHASAKGTNPGQAETGSWAQEEGSTNYLGLFGNHIFIPDLPEVRDLKAYYDRALRGLGGRGIGDEGWYGRLPYSVDHDVKVSLFGLAPGGVLYSAAFEWVSGYYWEKLGYVPFFGGYYSYPEGRGTRPTPGHAYFDLGLEKGLRLGGLPVLGETTLSVRLDVFNLFNSQRPISFVKEDIPIFGEVWGRQQPRQARMMVKVSF